MAKKKPLIVPDEGSGPPVAVAWLVHAFTATGALWALLALVAVEDRDWTMALVWLLVALFVDGVDGSMARWARVKVKAPRIDGDTLDLVIDYLTFVLVPVLFLWRAELIPPPLAPWLAGSILISSLYVFARTDMKTDAGYFRGFPALWNLVAFYLFVLQVRPEIGAVIVVVLVAMTFAPIHFVHPFRVRDYGPWLPALTAVWGVATCALLWPDLGNGLRSIFAAVSIASAVVLIALGLLRSLRDLKQRRA